MKGQLVQAPNFISGKRGQERTVRKLLKASKLKDMLGSGCPVSNFHFSYCITGLLELYPPNKNMLRT